MNKYLLAGIAVLSLAFSGYFYYSQNKIEKLIESNKALEVSVSAQQDAISFLHNSYNKQLIALKQLQSDNSILNAEKTALSDKLLKHDWEELSKRKPGLMENRLNAGTKELFDSFMSITSN